MKYIFFFILFLFSLHFLYYRFKTTKKAKAAYKGCRYDFYGSINEHNVSTYGIIQVQEVSIDSLKKIIQSFFLSKVKLFQFGKETFIFYIEELEETKPIEHLTTHILNEIHSINIYSPVFSAVLLNKNIPITDIIEILFGGINISKRNGEPKTVVLDFEDKSTYDMFGLAKQGYVPFYQPIMNITKKKVVGIESFVRWSSDNGVLLPNVFVPVAIKRNLIAGIDMKITLDALKLNEHLLSLRKPLVPISLNIAKESISEDFIEGLKKSLLVFDIECVKHVVFDFKLSELSEETIILIEKIQVLGYGVCLKIDQYCEKRVIELFESIGFTSLKIDKKFISQTEFATLKQFLYEHDVSITATYVETYEDAELVSNENISNLQGYHYEKPINEFALLEKYALKEWTI